MLIDTIIVFIYQYFTYVILILALAKLLVLFAHKPDKPKYVVDNFLRVYNKFDLRDDKKEKWDNFLKKNIPLTIAFYFAICIWLFTFGIMFFFSKA